MSRMLLLAIGFAISQYGYSDTLHHARIIADETKITGKTIVSFEDKQSIPSTQSLSLKMQHNLLKKHNLRAGKDGVLLRNWLAPWEEYPVGEMAELKASSEIYIENFTNVTQIYDIGTSFCVTNSDSSEGDCAVRTTKVEVDADGFLELNLQRSYTVYSETPTMYGVVLASLVDSTTGSSYFGTYASGAVAFYEATNPQA